MFTGIGSIAGWLAAIPGLSFYARKRIGTKTWRTMHRFTIVVYMLALAHVIGAGTNGTSHWMLALLTALTAPIVFAFHTGCCRLHPGAGRTAPQERPPQRPAARREPLRNSRSASNAAADDTAHERSDVSPHTPRYRPRLPRPRWGSWRLAAHYLGANAH